MTFHSISTLSHIATQRVEVPANVAFDYLADPMKLGRWSLGCFDTRPGSAQDIYSGTSLYDGAPAWFRITGDRSRGWVDFHLGTPDRLIPRISARIVPGGHVDLPDHSCLVSLIAWRSSAMDDARWQRLCAAHEAEIWLIKMQIERDHGEQRENNGPVG